MNFVLSDIEAAEEDLKQTLLTKEELCEKDPKNIVCFSEEEVKEKEKELSNKIQATDNLCRYTHEDSGEEVMCTGFIRDINNTKKRCLPRDSLETKSTDTDCRVLMPHSATVFLQQFQQVQKEDGDWYIKDDGFGRQDDYLCHQALPYLEVSGLPNSQSVNIKGEEGGTVDTSTGTPKEGDAGKSTLHWRTKVDCPVGLPRCWRRSAKRWIIAWEKYGCT